MTNAIHILHPVDAATIQRVAAESLRSWLTGGTDPRRARRSVVLGAVLGSRGSGVPPLAAIRQAAFAAILATAEIDDLALTAVAGGLFAGAVEAARSVGTDAGLAVWALREGAREASEYLDPPEAERLRTLVASGSVPLAGRSAA